MNDVEKADWISKPFIPLDSNKVPRFPLDCLPSYMRTYIEAVALSHQVPQDMVAMLAIATIATVIQRKVDIIVPVDHIEPLNTYVAIVLESGNRKSSTFRRVIKPLQDYEREIAEKMADKVRQAESELRVLEARQKQAEQIKARAKKDEMYDADLNLRTANDELHLFKKTMPRIPRLLADNITSESLQVELAANEEKMAVVSADTDIFSLMKGRYSGMIDTSLYLVCHAGDQVKVDRMGRHVILEKPLLTLAFTVQPSVLRQLKGIEQDNERGLVGRFWYSVPDSLIGTRLERPTSISQSVISGWDKAIGSLLEIPTRRDELGRISSYTLRLSPEADDYYWKAYQAIEKLREDKFGKLSDLPGTWRDKLEGTVARLAGILHMADNAGEPNAWEIPIEKETIVRAFELSKYLTSHARVAGEMMGVRAPILEGAQLILSWIQKNNLKAFTKRDLYQSLRRRFGEKASNLDEPLLILEDHGIVWKEPTGTKEQRFLVHPDVENRTQWLQSGVGEHSLKPLQPDVGVKNSEAKPSKVNYERQQMGSHIGDNHSAGKIL